MLMCVCGIREYSGRFLESFNGLKYSKVPYRNQCVEMRRCALWAVESAPIARFLLARNQMYGDMFLNTLRVNAC